MHLDLVDNHGEQGKSKGNLIKWELYNNTPLNPSDKIMYVKTGGWGKRNYVDTFGLEPLIEVLTYRIGKLLGLDITEQHLGVVDMLHLNEVKSTLINYSYDFRDGMQFTEYDNRDLLLDECESDKTRPIIGYPTIKKYFGESSYPVDIVEQSEDSIDWDNYDELDNLSTREYNRDFYIKMMLFDLIIMNQDRHGSNFGYLYYPKEDVHRQSPLYDHGNSLCYDDVKLFLKGYSETAIKGTPNYGIWGSFSAMEKIIKDYCSQIGVPQIKHLINTKLTYEDIETVVNEVKTDYYDIRSITEVDNILLDDTWFNIAIEFIYRRYDYVRNLSN